MRPELLTITAFGPYAETEKIDFTLLEGRSMFVISGRTGAGKTTIFDAMTFALYGRASGALRNASDFRSQYAEPDRKTEVDFTFTIRDTRYRIVRQPQQPHPKNKTPIPHEAVLYEWEEKWKPLATKVGDVEQRIESVLQLTYDQFSQILLLPQNQFRQLLDSDSMKKQQILQSIFKTEAYRAFQENWVERYSKFRKQVEWAIETTKLKLLELEDEDIEKVVEWNLPEIEIWLGQRNERLIQEADDLKKSRNDHLERLSVFRTELEQANALLRLFVERDEQGSALEAYRAGEEDRIKRRKLIGELEVASRIQPLYEKYSSSKQRVTQLETERTASQNRMREYSSKLDTLIEKEESMISYRKEVDTASARVKTIDEMLPFVDEWQTAIAERDKLKRTTEQLSTFVEEPRLIELRKKEDMMSSTLQEETAQNQLIEEERMYDRLIIHAQLENRLESLSERLTQCERKGKEAQRRWREQSDLVKQYERDEHAVWARELSSKLTEGEPCPVCGSLTHQTVERVNTSLDQAEVEAAVSNLQLFETALHEARADYRSLKQQVEEVRTEIEASKSQLKLSQPISQAVQEQEMVVRSLHEKVKRKLQIEQTYRKLTIELKQLEKSKQDQVERRQQSLEKLQAVQERLYTMRQLVNVSLPELTKERAELVKKIEQYQYAITTHERDLDEANRLKWGEEERVKLLDEQLKQESKHHLDAWTELDNSLAKHTMSKETFLHYIDQIDQLSVLRESLSHELEEGIRIEHSFNALTTKIGNASRPDITSLKQRLEEEQAIVDTISEQVVTAEARLKRHNQIVSDWNTLRQQSDQDQQSLEMIKLIADTGRGLNPQKMTFETYVQTAFFDQILHAANTHLDQMTSGQFKLERKVETAKGNAKSGLELLVFDAYTGQSRRVQNLSGGEGFKASLSLALGLAEVVQQLSGGVSLETMLIDEGFGTLDAESLDQAIELLMSLQSSGRLVGVISHVQELKDRVDARIEVKKSRSGSTIQLVVE